MDFAINERICRFLGLLDNNRRAKVQIFNETANVLLNFYFSSSVDDICEYPDTDRIIIAPNGETFRRSELYPYFDGETEIDKVWNDLGNKKN